MLVRLLQHISKRKVGWISFVVGKLKVGMGADISKTYIAPNKTVEPLVSWLGLRQKLVSEASWPIH